MYYLADSDDRALALASLPQPAGGSPLIISSDIDIRFAYAVAGDWLSTRDARLLQDPADGFVEVSSDEGLGTETSVTDIYAV